MKMEDVQIKLDMIVENLEKLAILKDKSYDEFQSDFRNIDSSLHRLQTSIQALVDIGSYIIASLGLRAPSNSAEVIEILVEQNLLEKEKQDRYISMIQFRNRIVYLYNDIDIKVLHQILQNELDDIRNLYGKLIRIIQAESE